MLIFVKKYSYSVIEFVLQKEVKGLEAIYFLNYA